MTKFRALMIEEPGKPANVRQLEQQALPKGQVRIKVAYSSLNYKDALAVTGQGKIIRRFPMVPGIDLTGTVVQSDAPSLPEGCAVVVTGWGMGEKHAGGLAEYADVPGDWPLALPGKLSPFAGAAIGTAGLTAMLCVMALEEAGIRPEAGSIAVTGAGGGVGGLAIRLLAALGYRVTAVSRRSGTPEMDNYYRQMGAAECIRLDELGDPDKPLLSERWAGAIDSVGGDVLPKLLAATAYRGCVAACGLAGGSALRTTVLPFILRGVRLEGIDSVYCPTVLRKQAWLRLADLLTEDVLRPMTEQIALEEVPSRCERMLRGEERGRLVVAL